MATVDNDIIKITLASNSSGNVITVSPGISALGSVSISLNEINNVDTTGIVNGQTIVYQNGSFVAGDAGVQTLEELTDTNIIGVQGGDVIAWNSGASKWMVSDGLQTLLSLLKSQSGTQLYSTSLDTDKGYIDLQATTAKMGLGQSFLKVTQTSPGVLTFSIACGAEGAETEFEAFKLQGTTTTDVADLLIQSGCRFKLYDTNGYEIWIRPSGGMTGNVTLVTPATGGTLALQSEIPTSVTDLSDVTSAGSGAIITTAERDAIGGMPAGGTTGQALVKVDGTDYNTQWADIAVDVQYHDRYQSQSSTLRSGATTTTEIYYSAIADGDGYAESASSDTPTSGYDIRRKLYYSEEGFADPDTGTWVQFNAIADNTTFANAKAALLAYLKERTGGTVPISLKMTWEEVSQTAYLLDQSYGSGAEAAYSTRQLRNAATDCMVIRRASDSTTTTIGFDGSGNIDESAITTFCTGTTCTVVTWKDQSGNGNDATQSDPTKQPTIYTGGALVKENGKVAVEFDGSNDFVATSDFTAIAQPFYFSLVAAPDSTALSRFIDTNGTVTNNRINITQNGTVYEINAGNSLTGGTPTTTQQLLTADFDTTSSFLYKDGAQIISGDVGTRNIDSIRIGANLNGIQVLNGRMQEVVFYASDKSSDRTSIESNIGDYFTQNTPLLDTYSGAAAAYSLRLLDSTYTGSAVEVYNGSSYADIGFNVFGELNTVALAAHCGSNDGFVSKIYDQSGGTLGDLVQTSTSGMRKIYDGATGYLGYLEKVGNGGYYRPSASSTISQPFSIFGVYDFGGLPDDYFFDSYGSTNRAGIIDNSIQNGTQAFGGGSIYGARNITGKSITSVIYNGASSAVSVNGETAVTGTLTGDFDFITLGARYTTTATSALDKIYEFVLYENAKNDADRVGIQDNLNSYYSAY